jgi:hypothetical protein
MIVLLSLVLNLVEKIYICSTIPVTPETSIKSPDLKSLQTMSNTPEALFQNANYSQVIVEFH